MIEEAYVSFEIAKLLKEKRFNCPCRVVYSPKGVVKHYLKEEVYAHYLKGHKKLCPTQQMVMRWLRKVYGIFIAINNDDLDFNWQCYDLINRDDALDPKILSGSYAGYKTYEDAVEAALKYCLENLI